MGIEPWWDKYLTDPTFRLEQEVEAYQHQYQAASIIDPNPQRLFNFARALATDLSGPLYGKCISFFDALARIRS
jgi:hypothetical protein